ncbi:MAG: hypothetical protein U0746_21375 [Gemmataceae bacterium]
MYATILGRAVAATIAFTALAMTPAWGQVRPRVMPAQSTALTQQQQQLLVQQQLLAQLQLLSQQQTLSPTQTLLQQRLLGFSQLTPLQQIRAQQIFAQIAILRQQETLLFSNLQQISGQISGLSTLPASAPILAQISALQRRQAQIELAIRQVDARIQALTGLL